MSGITTQPTTTTTVVLDIEKTHDQNKFQKDSAATTFGTAFLPYSSSGNEEFEAEQNKKKLICRLPLIVEGTSDIYRILTELLSRGVLHWRERDIIMAHASDYDRTLEVCKTVLYRGDKYFKALLEAFRITGNKEAVRALTDPLNETEANQSFEECLLALNIVQKNKLGAALHEIQSFNVTLASTNEFHFIQTGKTGYLGVSQVLTEYAVVNNFNKTLFYFIWKPIDAGLQLAHTRPLNVCDPCWPPRRGVTRICQNLLGNTIMEVDTELCLEDIRVGGDYRGQITPDRAILCFIKGYNVINAQDRIVYRIERIEYWWQHFICFSKTSWRIYGVPKNSLEPYAEFGSLSKQAAGISSNHEMMMDTSINKVSSYGDGDVVFKFLQRLNPEEKMLLLGASIMVLDHRSRVTAWSGRKIFFLYMLFLVLLIILMIILPILAAL